MRQLTTGTAGLLAGLAVVGGARAQPFIPLAPTPAPVGGVPAADSGFGNGPFSGQPYSGGLLSNLGTDVRVSDLRPTLERFFQTQAAAPATTPSWLVQPSIGVDAGVTDNALRVNSPRRADFFTVISPAVVVSGDTARLKVNLAYTPQISIYATQSSQTRADQFFSGQALGIIVPDMLFIDLRGNVSVTSLTGNGLQDTVSNSNYNRQNEVTTTTFSITPYAEHRFGGYGTARLGYSFNRTLQDLNQNQVTTQNLLAQNSQNAQNLNALGTPAYGAVGNLTTQRERFSYATGENLGRFNDFLTAQAIQYNGSGSYRGAFRNEVQDELGYALTRRITALAGIGYQDIRYAGSPQVRIREPSYNFGARYTPNPDSTLTVLYGRHDGIGSISFDGQYAPTARTRLIGRYSTGITSDLEETQDVLEASTVGSNGLVTDTATGAPVSSGSFFGIENGVYKVRRLSLNALLLQDRNSYSVGLVYEDRTNLTNTPNVLGNTVVPAGQSSTSVYGTFSWQHELTPDINSNVGVQYGVTNNTQQFLGASTGTQNTFSVTAGLTRQLTETLTGNVRYTFTSQSGGNGVNSGVLNATAFGNTGSYTENAVLVGLRKSF